MNYSMPIRAAPYQHQREAYDFALRLFRLKGGDAPPVSTGVSLLMEMG